MQQLSNHLVLVHGDTFEQSLNQLFRFFDLTTLVSYDRITERKDLSYSGLDGNFWDQLHRAEQKNRATLADLIADLQQNGVTSLQDIAIIKQGYVSKVFHILSHFLDGFIGIDSYFYNLPDDSHWVPEKTIQQIKDSPGEFWLIHVDCFAAVPGEAGIFHL